MLILNYSYCSCAEDGAILESELIADLSLIGLDG
jgi:hypothetical protein